MVAKTDDWSDSGDVLCFPDNVGVGYVSFLVEFPDVLPLVVDVCLSEESEEFIFVDGEWFVIDSVIPKVFFHEFPG